MIALLPSQEYDIGDDHTINCATNRVQVNITFSHSIVLGPINPMLWSITRGVPEHGGLDGTSQGN
jgi:hypothetical protein